MSSHAVSLESQPPIIRPRVALEIKVVDVMARGRGFYVSFAALIVAVGQSHRKNGGSFLRDGGRHVLRWRG